MGSKQFYNFRLKSPLRTAIAALNKHAKRDSARLHESEFKRRDCLRPKRTLPGALWCKITYPCRRDLRGRSRASRRNLWVLYCYWRRHVGPSFGLGLRVFRLVQPQGPNIGHDLSSLQHARHRCEHRKTRHGDKQESGKRRGRFSLRIHRQHDAGHGGRCHYACRCRRQQAHHGQMHASSKRSNIKRSETESPQAESGGSPHHAVGNTRYRSKTDRNPGNQGKLESSTRLSLSQQRRRYKTV